MRVTLPALGASLSLFVAIGCSEAPPAAGPVVPSGGSGGSAGNPAGGNGTGGTTSAGMAGSAAGSTSAGQAGSGGAAGGAGAGGASGAGGEGGGFVFSNDPGTRAYEMHCLKCHGPDGMGTVLAPETQHPVRDYSTWVVRHGLPGMGYLKPMEIIPPEMLSDADLNLIYDYLDKPPQPTTAQGLYLDYCGNCHGADGKGGPTTRDITGAVSHPLLEVSREGTHPGMFEERNEYMPGYPTSRISDAELQLINDYVNTL
jgi:mono/diheme cytochrome c family protein